MFFLDRKMKQTYFDEKWFKDEKFVGWLQKGKDNEHFGCKFCQRKNLKLSNMGVRALRSHVTGKKHLDAKKLNDEVHSFFKKQSSSSTKKTVPLSTPVESEVISIETKDVTEVNTSEKQQSTITHNIETSKVLRAEIIWTLTSVMKDFSNNSSKDLNFTFQAMFDDSDVAENYQCGPDKVKYLTNWGIAPWVKGKLNTDIEKSTFIVVSFDESLNQTTQSCQMDFILRYWDASDDQVKTNYWDSKFLGHTTHSDLLSKYDEALVNVDDSKIIQLSMDGPSVNWKFYKSVEENRKKAGLPIMINIGSCGLHILHGAFKTGFSSTDWQMKQILKGSYQLLHDTHARRADYITVTGSNTYPSFFCGTRWIEDKDPADRLRQIWPNMVSITNFWLSLPKSKRPSGKSFENVKNAVEDVLTPAKLSFFSFLASLLQPFLTKYQTQKPLVPYLYTDVCNLIKSVLKLVVKDEVVDSCKAGYQYMEIDFKSKNVFKESKDYNIGFETEGLLSNLEKKDLISIDARNKFNESAKTCIVALVLKINERCDLKSTVLQCAVIFNPVAVFKSKLTVLVKKLKNLIKHLVYLKYLEVFNGDKIIFQYNSLKSDISQIPITELSQNKVDRLDLFYFKVIKVGEKYPELSKVIKIILTLSHGQADVERGFSLNKGVLEDNLKEQSIVSKRLIKGFMISNQLKPYSMYISRELKKSCRHARLRYHKFLEDERKEKKETSVEAAKELLNLEIEEIKGKISSMEKSRVQLDKKFISLVKEAEKSKDIAAKISEANALKRKSEEQVEDIRKLEEAMNIVVEKKKKL